MQQYVCVKKGLCLHGFLLAVVEVVVGVGAVGIREDEGTVLVVVEVELLVVGVVDVVVAVVAVVVVTVSGPRVV